MNSAKKQASGKEPACQFRSLKSCGFNPCIGKIPWRRKWQPILVFLLGESHGQRSLVSYSPRGGNELDVTECLSTKITTVNLKTNILITCLTKAKIPFLICDLPESLDFSCSSFSFHRGEHCVCVCLCMHRCSAMSDYL